MRMTKRFGCLILSMALVFGMFPATAFAAEGFRDVSAGDWYFETVHQVTDLNLMKGIDSDRFDPKGTASRAMLATVIWRADGSPAASCSEAASVAGSSAAEVSRPLKGGAHEQ